MLEMINKEESKKIDIKDYYINEVPKDIIDKYKNGTVEFGQVEYRMAKDKVRLFNKKYVNDIDELLGAESELNDLNQPSKKTVDNAMIWTWGVVGEKPTYIIKSGGGSMSDNQYISEFHIVIPDPKTGEDKRVLLLKKFSNEFNDVLITREEINSLYMQFMNEKQKIDYKNHQIKLSLAILGGALINVERKGKYVSVRLTPSDKEWEIVINEAKSQADNDYILEYIDKEIKRFKNNTTNINNPYRIKKYQELKQYFNFKAESNE